MRTRPSKGRWWDWFHAPDCAYAINEWRGEKACDCSIHPGLRRGYPAEREILSGSFVIPPAEHVGHTVTVLGPYGVTKTPSHKPRLAHRVRCSCGQERIMEDDDLREALLAALSATDTKKAG